MAPFLYIVLILLIVLLITLVEAVVLTWLKWAGFGQSLVSALAANLVSNLAIVILLLFADRPRLPYLIVGWLVSTLIETLILHLFRRQPAWRTLLSALTANLASYVILYLPSYYYGMQ